MIVVRVAGEVDLYTVAVLRDALADSLARGPCALLIDVAAMTFCDVRGLTLLVQTAATATERGIDYAITAAPRQARRVWSMLWPADEVPIQYPSAAAGILAAMSRQTRGNRTDDVARWAPKHSPGWTRHWPTARPTGAADRGLMITERLSGPPS
ncbi:STAS domain-containing protein [Pseudonocardia sp. GCM10023141]